MDGANVVAVNELVEGCNALSRVGSDAVVGGPMDAEWTAEGGSVGCGIKGDVTVTGRVSEPATVGVDTDEPEVERVVVGCSSEAVCVAVVSCLFLAS